ncbi:hypothetical protein ACTXT7_014992 [Hymenolepis weldensis]
MVEVLLSRQLRSGTKAIFASRNPFHHKVSINHILTPVRPTKIAHGATSRSHDFEIKYKPSQRAEQNLNEDQFRCLNFPFGLPSPCYGEIRLRLLSILDKEPDVKKSRAHLNLL